MKPLLKFIIGVFLIWVLGFVWFMLALPGPADEDVKTDGIVVLTGGPGRLARGVALIGEGRAARLLVSGVDPAVKPGELAEELDAEARLFDCCIDLGKRAADTAGNGTETAEWATARGYTSLRVITAADHMRRARLELDAQLPADMVVVEDAVPSSGGFVSLVREYGKFTARLLASWVGRA
ncbi:MAG: YdcF family protein [Pacificimonas sp.]